MSSILHGYPDNARFAHVLPKNKIYGHAKPSTAVKEYFIRDVEQIVWEYKLAPETINIPATAAVPEIQIFYLDLKEGECNRNVLRTIDRAIPFPILFELRYSGQIQSVAAYKRPSEAEKGKWVVGEYFESEWIKAETSRKPLPVVFDLDTLYASLLGTLLPCPAKQGELLQVHVERVETLAVLQREAEKLEKKIAKEKQFNFRVELNEQLKKLQKEMDALMS